MMKQRVSLLVLLAFVLLCIASALAQVTIPEEKNQQAQVEQEKTIIPSPKDIKEKTAIYVFVGWMWLSIIVLIFILKAKIREVDRLHRIKFFSNQDSIFRDRQ
jgi:hypothetical protein